MADEERKDERRGERRPAEGHEPPLRSKLREMLGNLSFVPDKPSIVDWEIHVVPRVFLVHPLTGERFEVEPRRREEKMRELAGDKSEDPQKKT